MMRRAGRRGWNSGQNAYSHLTFSEKRRHALRGIAEQALYQCRLCPVKVTERDRKGHMQRSHAGQERGTSMRRLFKEVKE